MWIESRSSSLFENELNNSNGYQRQIIIITIILDISRHLYSLFIITIHLMMDSV